jgi:hypothetical protein
MPLLLRQFHVFLVPLVLIVSRRVLLLPIIVRPVLTDQRCNQMEYPASHVLRGTGRRIMVFVREENVYDVLLVWYVLFKV